MLGILYYGTKLEANARNSVLNHSAEKKNNSEFRSQACLKRKHAVNSVCWSRMFCKKLFFMPFPSVPSFVIDSSVKLGMPRNEHFLPRNNGSCSESIPRNFFDEIPLPTLAVINRINTNVSCLTEKVHHNISEDILLSYRVLLVVFYAQIYALRQGLINYVTTKVKCRHLKILTCKGTLRQVSELSFFFPFLETPNTAAYYPMSVRHSLRNYQRRKAFISDFSIEK
jgi:hypothetical protein